MSNLCELSILLGGGFFSLPPLELLLETFLTGWAAREFLLDVVFLGVTTGY